MVYPIIIYPYNHPNDTKHLDKLFSYLKELASNKKIFKPLTVISADVDYQMRNWKKNETYINYINDIVSPISQIIYAWSVDTCQRWLSGFGEAIQNDKKNNDGVYWLIPGDFHYDSQEGTAVLNNMSQIYEKVLNGNCELCIGQIEVPPNSSKQLIDTYGTYGLLYNWFPAEAQGMIKFGITKPRTEFFAIRNNYLRLCLERRWYPYEQTITILLHGLDGSKQNHSIDKVFLGKIDDDSDSRDKLANAMQQIDRMERMLKQYWREKQQWNNNRTWPNEFRILDAQSKQICGTALIILQNILSLP